MCGSFSLKTSPLFCICNILEVGNDDNHFLVTVLFYLKTLGGIVSGGESSQTLFFTSYCGTILALVNNSLEMDNFSVPLFFFFVEVI